MKYAFLIAAHSDAEQLLRLMKRLLSLGDIYVHIDKKVKDSDYLNKVKAFASNVGGKFRLLNLA